MARQRAEVHQRDRGARVEPRPAVAEDSTNSRIIGDVQMIGRVVELQATGAGLREVAPNGNDVVPANHAVGAEMDGAIVDQVAPALSAVGNVEQAVNCDCGSDDSAERLVT